MFNYCYDDDDFESYFDEDMPDEELMQYIINKTNEIHEMVTRFNNFSGWNNVDVEHLRAKFCRDDKKMMLVCLTRTIWHLEDAGDFIDSYFWEKSQNKN